MKIVVFTSSFLRHRYLIDKISKKFENVIYICEKKPYIRSKETKNKKEYFRKVKIVEKKIFKKIKKIGKYRIEQSPEKNNLTIEKVCNNHYINTR